MDRQLGLSELSVISWVAGVSDKLDSTVTGLKTSLGLAVKPLSVLAGDLSLYFSNASHLLFEKIIISINNQLFPYYAQ